MLCDELELNSGQAFALYDRDPQLEDSSQIAQRSLRVTFVTTGTLTKRLIRITRVRDSIEFKPNQGSGRGRAYLSRRCSHAELGDPVHPEVSRFNLRAFPRSLDDLHRRPQTSGLYDCMRLSGTISYIPETLIIIRQHLTIPVQS